MNAAVQTAMATTVDSTVRSCINKATVDMQLYTDGVETSLVQTLDALRAQLGLAAQADDPDPLTRNTAGAAETGPDGHRVDTTT